MPLYLALDHAHLVPVALRDRPWPLEALALAATVAAIAHALRRRDALAIGAAAVALAGALWLSIDARAIRFRLPAPSRELALGRLEEDFTLPDSTGAKLTLSSLRGHPALLVYYRGSW
jgi:hypothetical protein